MARGESTGWVKKAKRRDKLQRMADLYPEDAERYTKMQDDLTQELSSAGVCVVCGREIRSDDATSLGIGKDCLARLQQDGASPRWLTAAGIVLPD